MTSQPPSATFSTTLLAHLEHTVLPSPRHTSLRTSLLPALLSSIATISTSLRRSIHVSAAGTSNAFGDAQLNVDIAAENLIRSALAACPCVAAASSEEEPVERLTAAATDVAGERYAVAFDPLDGSSIVGANWTVGSIFGVWEGSSALGQAPEKQVCAILGVYGPRTTAYVAVRAPGAMGVCFEVGIGEREDMWELLRAEVRLAEPPFGTRYFAPANLRTAGEDSRYMALISRFIGERYTLRYCGGLVPDIVHALVKGHGVYVSPVTARDKAKLRRLYELYPIALVLECAGGKAFDPADGADILSKPLQHCDERAGLVCGTAEDTELAKQALLG